MSLADYTDEQLRAELRRRERAEHDEAWHDAQGHRLITTPGDEAFRARRGCLTCDVWFGPPRRRAQFMVDSVAPNP